MSQVTNIKASPVRNCVKQARDIALAVSGTFIGIFCFSEPAPAQMQVCNRSSYPASLVYASYQTQDKNLTSEGWNYILPGECTTIISREQFISRFIFLRAFASQKTGDSYSVIGGWRGGYSICIKTNSGFRLRNAENRCPEGQGYQWEEFFKIDTGNNRTFTYTLQDSENFFINR